MAFQIQQITRVRDDPCDVTVQNKESVGPGSYQLSNMVPKPAQVAQLAYTQPVIPIREGYGWSRNSIDVDSTMRNHAVQTNSPHCPIRASVQARPFASVPYMGRGKGEAELESRLQMSEFVRTGKECGSISETFYENQFTPMIPHVAANIQNPVHLIPEVASRGWVHGGIPSRQTVRDMNC